LIFLFFAGSGSRRSYYIIPIIPFVILVTAEWLHTKIQISHIAKKIVVATAIISYVFIFAALDVLYPISNQGGGIQTFAKTIRHEAVKTQDWQKWHIVMYQTKNIIAFYLKSPNLVTFIDVKNPQKIKTIIDNSYQNTIIVTNKNQAKMIEKYGKYKLLAITPDYGHLITKKPLKTVALIPESKKDMK